MEIALADEGWEVRKGGGGEWLAVYCDSGTTHELEADDYLDALAEAVRKFARERYNDGEVG